ncbi:glycosyl hydrolase 108 family protein [Albimonas sp. CAU 1670]|uniref:glycoside hydrolase family 108 protein n=1 Tax=Albimonas sp. CAU 1670 TaxID=3032599 RepID=UPI0023DCC4B1|nr:glycosyl hydrolase 108 family protein [Albimonas sp. CAU 1670]MDF2235377.1 glycosyl hydrolase 108 family protein [Albimonas sp. CAU 1670]
MREIFPTALGNVLSHEGGYVNHPADPGGATNQGVTQRTYDGWRIANGLAPRSVRLIEADEVRAIYLAQYWAAVAGDLLPAGLDYAVFDFAVNSGPARAARFLQAELGVPQDGQVGAITLAAVRGVNDIEGLIGRLCEARLAWMHGLSTWRTFGRGWTRRVMGQRDGAQDDDTGVIDRAAFMARGIAQPLPIAPAPGRAVPVTADDDLAEFQTALRALNARHGLPSPGRSDGLWGPATAGATLALHRFMAA